MPVRQGVAEGGSQGSERPLKGAPVLVKDVVVAGAANYLASQLLADLDIRSDATDEFVRRAENAGMIVVGRTNVPELLSAPTTDSRLHGPARNPLRSNPARRGFQWRLSGGSGGFAPMVNLKIPAPGSSACRRSMPDVASRPCVERSTQKRSGWSLNS
ncbi:hypothetical protein E8E95_00675 [Pseudomonas sp. BN414]|nr:hypothetical protein [Pseudomonas sp. BN414]